MKKSIHIDLSVHFGSSRPIDPLAFVKPKLQIKHANTMAYGNDDDYVIEQEFDGKFGYLYCYEGQLAQETDIPMHVSRADLHLFYLMGGNSTLSLQTASGERLYSLQAQRARYLYLPAGEYVLTISKGYALIFGFYFDGGIFREPNMPPF